MEHLLGLKKAALELAYDSGMIHNYKTEEEYLTDVGALLTEKYIGTQLEEVNAALAALDPLALSDLCSGDEDQRAAALKKVPAALRGLTDDMLEVIFEGTYSHD